jgi:hypothetical protein
MLSQTSAGNMFHEDLSPHRRMNICRLIKKGGGFSPVCKLDARTTKADSESGAQLTLQKNSLGKFISILK